MSRERLLERVDGWERGSVPHGEECCTASLLAHLRQLLNTRRGDVPIADDYGAPDLIAMLQTFPESVATMEEAIRSAVERYEPRLGDVVVRFRPQEPETLMLTFDVAGTLRDPDRQRISFESSIDMIGKVRVRSGQQEESRSPVLARRQRRGGDHD